MSMVIELLCWVFIGCVFVFFVILVEEECVVMQVSFVVCKINVKDCFVYCWLVVCGWYEFGMIINFDGEEDFVLMVGKDWLLFEVLNCLMQG